MHAPLPPLSFIPITLLVRAARSVTEAIHTAPFPFVITPFASINMTVRPALGAVAVSSTVAKLAGIQQTIGELLHTEAVGNVAACKSEVALWGAGL